MTAEVLDAAYPPVRAGIFRCLPYSGLAVLVLELPTLYSTFLVSAGDGASRSRIPTDRLSARYFCSSVALLGVITLRLNAVAQGCVPVFAANSASR